MKKLYELLQALSKSDLHRLHHLLQALYPQGENIRFRLWEALLTNLETQPDITHLAAGLGCSESTLRTRASELLRQVEVSMAFFHAQAVDKDYPFAELHTRLSVLWLYQNVLKEEKAVQRAAEAARHYAREEGYFELEAFFLRMKTTYEINGLPGSTQEREARFMKFKQAYTERLEFALKRIQLEELSYKISSGLGAVEITDEALEMLQHTSQLEDKSLKIHAIYSLAFIYFHNEQYKRVIAQIKPLTLREEDFIAASATSSYLAELYALTLNLALIASFALRREERMEHFLRSFMKVIRQLPEGDLRDDLKDRLLWHRLRYQSMLPEADEATMRSLLTEVDHRRHHLLAASAQARTFVLLRSAAHCAWRLGQPARVRILISEALSDIPADARNDLQERKYLLEWMRVMSFGLSEDWLAVENYGRTLRNRLPGGHPCKKAIVKLNNLLQQMTKVNGKPETLEKRKQALQEAYAALDRKSVDLLKYYLNFPRPVNDLLAKFGLQPIQLPEN